jgi:tetratricopeptide (TPR) repeat protein
VALNREKILEAAQGYAEKRKFDKAVLELRKLTNADPRDVRALQKIGDLQIKQGQWAEAIDTFESVGRFYSEDGFALKAVAVYKQIREMIATHLPQLEARYAHIAPKLADLYREMGLTNDALVLLNQVAQRLQHQQRHAEAIDIFRRISDLDPNNPIPHLHIAEGLSRAGDAEGAVAGFKAAAALLVAANRRDDAIQVLERLLHHRADPEQARICAELYLSRARPPHDVTQALAKLQWCFQANPKDVGVLSLIARSFEMLGQTAKAQEVHKEIARISRGG